ncbi:MAG: glycosyltransferase family 2 protein [Cyclobacteriaceae bacterium]|jgi:glycosyltransferase involved in cell wall biosynthesis
MNTVKISGCIITYNEEKNIERCLQSLTKICDEIVVIDSYSTDKTVEICEKLQVRVFQNAFEGYIEQKNFALTKCLNNWVISLDADECLSPELQEEILKLDLTVDNKAYAVNRLTNFAGKWIRYCGWYPDRKTRLFNKDSSSWGGKNPHDRIEHHERTHIIKLKGDLLHYSFEDISDHVSVINKFSAIGAKSAFEQGRKPNFFTQVLLDPFYTFIKKYFFQFGFLDGFYGFVISINTAHSKFLKYVKLRELHKNAGN